MSVIKINRNKNKTQSLGFGTYAFLIVAVIFSVFPLLCMLIAATNTSVDVISGTLIPGKN